MKLDSQIFEQRMLMFLETDAQSNKYRQIIVNNEQFKTITGLIGKIGETVDGIQQVQIEESEEIYDLPDLRSFNN